MFACFGKYEIRDVRGILICTLSLQLARAEHNERQRERERRNRRRGFFGYEEEGDTATDRKGLVGAMPEGMRQAALHLIDYQLTPMLVDQWR